MPFLSASGMSPYNKIRGGALGPAAIPFAFGNALHFDGVNDLIQTTSAANLTGTMGLSFWVKSAAGVSAVPFAKNGTEYIQTQPALNRIVGYVDNVGVWTHTYTQTPDVWQHFLLTYIGTEARVYINGVESSTGARANTAGRTFSINRVGSYSGASGSSVMTVDELAATTNSSGLTEAEALYNSGNGNDANAVFGSTELYYHLNESGTATTAVDSSGNGNDGTLINFATSGMWVPHTPVLLLDLYPSAAHASAYFLLKSDYTGALVELRRSTDNALKDFYPDASNELSLTSEDGAGTSLATWIGANDAFERTGYDQSGNGNNLQQTSTSLQNKLITGGVLNVVNGKVADDSTASQYYQFTNTLTPITTFIVNKMDAFGSANYVLWSAINVKGYALGGSAFGDKVSVYDGSVKQGVLNDLTQKLSYYNYNGTNFQISQNGGAETALAAGSSFSVDYLGRNTSGFSIDAQNQALIIYATDKSADKAGIQTVLNNYFSIYNASIDPDAQAYITAGSITNATEIAAINQMFLDLKGTGSTTNNSNIYSKFYALYPISPTGLSAGAVNAVNPATYDITWFNSPTYGTTGVTGNASNMYGSTNFTPSTHASSINDFGITTDVATTVGGANNIDMGAFTGSNITQINITNSGYTGVIGNLSSNIGGTTTVVGVRTLTRRAVNDAEFYLNGITDGVKTTLGGALVASDLFLMGRNDSGSIALPSARRYRFFAIHNGLTSNEARDLSDSINTYNANVISGGR